MSQPVAEIEEAPAQHMNPRHLRRTLYWLALDWLNLDAHLPTPQYGRGTRTSNTKEYGHPSEWASDKAREVVDMLTSWHDYLAEHRNETRPRRKKMGANNDGDDIWTWAVNDRARLISAWKYLEPRLEQLVELVDKEALDELPELHNKIRRALGHHAPKYTLPVPCPNEDCSLRTLVRIQGIGQDFISCDSCGYTIKEVHYPFLIRMILDTLLSGAA